MSESDKIESRPAAEPKDVQPAEAAPQQTPSAPEVESTPAETAIDSAAETPIQPEAAVATSPDLTNQEQAETEAPARPACPEPVEDAGTANAAVLAESRRHTRRSFIVAGAGVAAAYGIYEYLNQGPHKWMQPGVFRDAFETNAAIAKDVFRDRELAPTYPISKAENLRVNGTFGLKMALVPDSWRLQLVGMDNAAQHPRYVSDVTAWEYRYVAEASKEDQGHDTKVDPDTARKMAPESMLAKAEEDENRTGRMPRGREEAGESKSTLLPGTPGLLLTVADIQKLPRVELVTQFKCIEGWSQIVQWAGVRMADFIEMYPPEHVAGGEPRFVYMETPDGDYYTGYDIGIMRHPQTLLVTEMMGAPLTQFHGAPLRLHMPTKYGYKQIKRIGLIAYTNQKPDDYWTKLGYDWYAGL